MRCENCGIEIENDCRSDVYCKVCSEMYSTDKKIQALVIDEKTKNAMIEMNEQAKRQRVDHKKEYYVKECGRLENECAQLKKELSEIKGRRKTSIWQRMYEHAQERMKV